MSNDAGHEEQPSPDRALINGKRAACAAPRGRKSMIGHPLRRANRAFGRLTAGRRRLDNYSRTPYYERGLSGAFLFLSGSIKDVQFITGLRITRL